MYSLLLSFAAGLLTIFNPCVLPLAPILVAGASARDARGPLALAAGLALTFGVVGGAVASLGVELGESPYVRYPAGVLMIVIGVLLLVPALGERSGRLFAPLVGLGDRLSTRIPQAGLLGNFALGGLLALVWAPCIGPTLGAALLLAASSGTFALAVLSMSLFAIGAATSLLAAGILLRRLAAGGRVMARRTALIGRMLFGAVLLLVGIGAVTGWDRLLEERIVQALPDWFVLFATRL